MFPSTAWVEARDGRDVYWTAGGRFFHKKYVYLTKIKSLVSLHDFTNKMVTATCSDCLEVNGEALTHRHTDGQFQQYKPHVFVEVPIITFSG